MPPSRSAGRLAGVNIRQGGCPWSETLGAPRCLNQPSPGVLPPEPSDIRGPGGVDAARTGRPRVQLRCASVAGGFGYGPGEPGPGERGRSGRDQPWQALHPEHACPDSGVLLLEHTRTEHQRNTARERGIDMSPGSADRQRHSCRTRMIDMGAFGLPPWTRTCCCQARAGLRLWPSQLARRHTQWRRVRRVNRSCRAVQRLLVGSVAVPGSSGESAARAGLPERRCSGYCSLAAWYCSSVTGFEPCRSLSSGDALEHGEVAHKVSGGGAVPALLAWRGVYFRPGKGQGSATSTCLVAVRSPRAVPR